MLARVFIAVITSSATLVSQARPSPRLTSLGYIQVSVGKDVIGYVSKTQNDNGNFIGVSPSSQSNDVRHRLLVEFDATTSSSQSFIAQNGPSNNFPFFGAIEGEDGPDLGNTGSYLLLGGTGETSPGAHASYVGNSFTDATGKSRRAESAIWQLNTTSGVLSARPVNTDGSIPNATYVGYVDGGFILSGSKKQFEKEWEDKVEWVTFTVTTD